MGGVSGCHNLFKRGDRGAGLWKFDQAGKGKEHVMFLETILRRSIKFLVGGGQRRQTLARKFNSRTREAEAGGSL